MEAEIKPENKQNTKKSERKNLKKTVLLAALIFLLPFTAAILLGLFANKISPVRQKAKAAREAQQIAVTNAPVCAAGAGISELLKHRQVLRDLGLPVEFTNIRIWAATSAKPALLINLNPPEDGVSWNWHLSQDGEHALAVEKSTGGGSLLKKVALYSFTEDLWLWKNRLPWPEEHEAPWVFNSTTVVRSAKNNRRFAMEINAAGDIIAIDSLGAGTPFSVTAPAPDDRFSARPVAEVSGVYFVCDEQDSTLKGYALNTLPGLYDAGPFDKNTCFSGNGLLKFRAADGTVTVYDAFTQLKLDQKEAWSASTNTAITTLNANCDGSELRIQFKSSFSMPAPVVREWSLLWQPANDIVEFNMTNAFSGITQTPSVSIQSPDRQWRIFLRDNSILEIAPEKSTGEVVKVDLKKNIPCNNNPITEISLLEGKRFILLKQRDRAYFLDLYAVLHYGDLITRREHCLKLLKENTDEECKQSDAVDNPIPEISSDREGIDYDNFNYEMIDYFEAVDPRLLEPPSRPSILSLQAEFLANHHAWLYASCKLEQLMQIQERDNRAPRANPLLYTRYHLLMKNNNEAKEGCRKALDSLFYDTTPFNQMIRWQMLKTLFN